MLNFFIAVVGGVYFLKVLALWKQRGRMTLSGMLAFLFAWPGVVPQAFVNRGAAEIVDAGRFLAAWTRMMLGAPLSCCWPYTLRRFPNRYSD
jgi:hypothetical protein